MLLSAERQFRTLTGKAPAMMLLRSKGLELEQAGGACLPLHEARALESARENPDEVCA